ncbi:hypothetical protein BKA70DRAFT_1264405 [Coprinopsis sp. MPI-PUGE-AT-0042]|nr:hypothetical protein BKA70DRAFT_1264405 [Coprinopsis sp. MPI-PUGE-AT-0042]
MPLDGHSYLVSQGWGGKGTGLRDGSISRPIIIAQKKTLAGLGKDRDEAFPFWDHLFSAAASAIKLKLDSSDDETSDSEGKTGVKLKRTATGIICNRRPVDGAPAHPGSDTSDSQEDSTLPRYTLLARAKREAAKRGLYSRFFRGPTLGPDTSLERGVKESSPKPEYPAEDIQPSLTADAPARVGAVMLQKRAHPGMDVEVLLLKKRKRDVDVGEGQGKKEKGKRRREKDKEGKMKRKDRLVQECLGEEQAKKKEGKEKKAEKDSEKKKKKRRGDEKKKRKKEEGLDASAESLKAVDEELLGEKSWVEARERKKKSKSDLSPPGTKSSVKKTHADVEHQDPPNNDSVKQKKRKRIDEDQPLKKKKKKRRRGEAEDI